LRFGNAKVLLMDDGSLNRIFLVADTSLAECKFLCDREAACNGIYFFYPLDYGDGNKCYGLGFPDVDTPKTITNPGWSYLKVCDDGAASDPSQFDADAPQLVSADKATKNHTMIWAALIPVVLVLAAAALTYRGGTKVVEVLSPIKQGHYYPRHTGAPVAWLPASVAIESSAGSDPLDFDPETPSWLSNRQTATSLVAHFYPKGAALGFDSTAYVQNCNSDGAISDLLDTDHSAYTSPFLLLDRQTSVPPTAHFYPEGVLGSDDATCV
jgi:hypothetical protein